MTHRTAFPDKKFYGRRRGRRLRGSQQALVDTLLPALRVPPPKPPTAAPEADRDLDPRRLFTSEPSRIWLEIGFGGGEHLAEQASRHPDIGFIGAEVFLNGIAKLLAAIDSRQIDNIRLWPEDARDLLTRLPDASLDRIFLLFPDPWPKARHADRRFLAPATIAELARVLKDGGTFRLASDHPVYQEWMVEHMANSPLFKPEGTDKQPPTERPDDWAPTRYEAKARREGRTPIYMTFVRASRASGS